MSRSSQVERIIAKGQLIPLFFHQDAVAASQTAVEMKTVEAAAVTLGTDEYRIPFDFEIVAISVESDTAAAGANLTVDATKNGTVTGLKAVLTSAGSDTSAHARQRRDTDVGVAGDRVGVKLTTPAGWSATGADISVVVFVLVHLEDV